MAEGLYIGLSKDVRTPSPREIAAAITDKGGWTREQLALWGVPFPPPHGWKRELERRYAEENGVSIRRAKVKPWRNSSNGVALGAQTRTVGDNGMDQSE
jgi:hypothetical protein